MIYTLHNREFLQQILPDGPAFNSNLFIESVKKLTLNLRKLGDNSEKNKYPP